MSQESVGVDEVLPEGSQDRSCENKISIYAAFEGKGEGGNLATKWPQDVLQDQ